MKQPLLQIHSALLQQTGTHHMQNHTDCEDIFYQKELPDFWFYGIADGQSGKPCCKEGGLMALQCLEEYILRQGVQRLLCTRFPDELPYEMMREIRRALLSAAEANGSALSDYASTLLAIAIDPRSKAYLLFHLGDGCALRICSDQSILMLSAPENIYSRHHTWLTTSDCAVSHARILFGSLQEQERLVLLSDGANLCKGKNIPASCKNLLCTGSGRDILKYWETKPPVDDASCILLDITSPAP